VASEHGGSTEAGSIVAGGEEEPVDLGSAGQESLVPGDSFEASPGAKELRIAKTWEKADESGDGGAYKGPIHFVDPILRTIRCEAPGENGVEEDLAACCLLNLRVAGLNSAS
jgi:hypothetical protein